MGGMCLLQSCLQRSLAVLKQRLRAPPSKALAAWRLRLREWRQLFNSTTRQVSGFLLT